MINDTKNTIRVRETGSFSVSLLFLYVLINCFVQQAYAQQPYFQQEVNYTIDVRLNDEQHILTGQEKMQYINNSATSLDFIYIHLWPNAYKDQNTALAKQLLKLKRTEFYYSKPEQRGYIDSLDFKVNSLPVKMEYDPVNHDICKIFLPEPLKSLDTIEITTPFKVKIPDASFSRFGHDSQAYFVTQWYPKPAVYDNSGWHQMPYLDQGEFFSEYGSFDVSITLPVQYVVATSGELVDSPFEEEFINHKIAGTIRKLDVESDLRSKDHFEYGSGSNLKTVRYKQYRVHDFAWFADKGFNVLHDEIKLPNTGRYVDTWIYFTDKNFGLWKDALDYVNDATIFYSYMLGDFPYNQVAAVDGRLMAGGGMEYPNITVIGEASSALELETTIAHEVGHNWFYGILGSNERDYPYMDEGLNSFYEMNYLRAKYPEKKLSEYVGLDTTRRIIGLNKIPYWKQFEFMYFMAAKSNIDQPLNLPSPVYSSFNYGAIVYSKSAVIFDYLRNYIGESVFDKAMQFYFENFKFKHPSPDDLFNIFQYYSGNDLSWFRDNLIDSRKKIDFKVKSVKRNNDGSWKIKYKNKSGFGAPIALNAYKNRKPIGIAWYSETDSLKYLDFPPSDVDYFIIDGFDNIPDVNRSNNRIRTRGIFKKSKPVEFSFLTKFPNPRKTQIHFLPALGYNMYNGLMGGLVLHNHSVYEKKFEFQFTPMYAIGNSRLVGLGEMNYNIFPSAFFRKISLNLRAKSFSSGEYDDLVDHSLKYYSDYLKIAPGVDFVWDNKDRTSSITNQLSIIGNYFLERSVYYSSSATNSLQTTAFLNKAERNLLEINYERKNSKIIHPNQLKLYSHINSTIGKIGIVYTQDITITQRYYFSFRLFGGEFFMGNSTDKGPYQFRLSGWSGAQDYLYEGQYIGRTEWQGFSSYQFLENDGAFKIRTPIGYSSSYQFAVNMKTPTLWKIPLKGFIDVGYTGDSGLNKNLFLWDMGLNLSLFKNIIEVYLPLAYSTEIKDNLALNNIKYPETFRFTLNIHQLNLKDILRNSMF